MSASNVSPSPGVPIGCPPPRQVIPLNRLRDEAPTSKVASTGMNGDAVGTVGTHISFSNAHAEKNDFGGSPETHVFVHSEKVLEIPVPTVPSQHAPSPPVYSLECGDPGFSEPEDGEWIVGLYREDDGTLVPLLLWADPDVDYFWDVARRRHALPPRFYVKLAAQPQIDPKTGYPIIDGAVCPF